MLIDAERSSLLVIDLQTKLVPALADAEQVVANVVWLVRIAQKLGIPVAGTEQYPKGLGPLVPKVRKLLPAGAIATKNHFSAVAAQCLGTLPGHDSAQIVVVGAEAHVCVMQTCLELLEDGREVYVVADAIASRHPADRDVALTRMRDEGVRVVTREMVAFEWLAEAGTPRFREINLEYFK
ncbi:MAG: isochorismatase family protein [Betaproteobacteria bacterium]